MKSSLQHAANPTPRGRAPLCACGCGDRTSTVRTEYIRGHRPRIDPRVRFWSKIDKRGPEECWEWTAALMGNGYALFRVSDHEPKIMAHRYAYQDVVGPIPDGLTIDHLCKNRACCNPAHMEVVTRGENAIRGGGTKAAVAVRKAKADRACPSGHPRTPEHARKGPDGYWRCRTCRNIREGRDSRR